MSWALSIGAAWLVFSTVLALGVARGVRLADEKQLHSLDALLAPQDDATQPSVETLPAHRSAFPQPRRPHD